MSGTQLLQTIKSKIHAKPSHITLKSIQQRELLYYPPSLSPVLLAQQDETLKKLNLIDVWLHNKVEKEQLLLKRGKPVRVSVVTGPSEKEEKIDKKGKKRK